MKISIAMATYNGAKYLQEQLDSFVAQTRQPDELVVCDDGSTDTTVDILESFRQQAPFAVCICRNEKNLGYVKNFEKALGLCTGDIIFLSDQDDVWFNNKISLMVGILEERHDIFILQTDMILADENMNPTPYTQLGNILATGQSPDIFISGCGTAIRKAWLDLALPIPSELAAHDNWIHRLALALGVRALHESPLQLYRRHGDNSSKWFVSKPINMTQLDGFLIHGLGDATQGWKKEFERVKASWFRLSESTEVLKNLGLIDRQETALAALNRRMENLNNRINNMKLSRFKRLLRVLHQWLQGGYADFAGWKSMAKDILRP